MRGTHQHLDELDPFYPLLAAAATPRRQRAQRSATWDARVPAAMPDGQLGGRLDGAHLGVVVGLLLERHGG